MDIKTIQGISLFNNLSEKKLQLISQKATFKIFPKDTVFIWQEEKRDNVYFILKGAVRVYKVTEEGDEVNIGFCGSGEIVGEMAIIEDSERSANVVTLQETEVLIIKGADFKLILHRCPEVALKMLSIFSKRLRENNQYIEELIAKNLLDRTYKVIKMLSNFFPNKDVPLSQEEISLIVGATRARVTEVLHTLQSQNKIVISHKKIHLI